MSDDTRPDALTALEAVHAEPLGPGEEQMLRHSANQDTKGSLARTFPAATVRRLLATLDAARLTPAPAAESGEWGDSYCAHGSIEDHRAYVASLAIAAESGEPETDGRYPCLVLVNGSIGSCIIAGTDYRVNEIREHWEPTGVEGEPPVITTVIRLDPVARAQGTAAAGLDVEEAACRLDNTDVVAADALRAEHPERFR